MTTVYFAGGEDLDFELTGGMAASTTSGRFRSAYARCSIVFSGITGAIGVAQSVVPFTASAFWFSSRIWCNAVTGTTTIVQFHDASKIVRLRLRCSVASAPPTFVVEKLDSVGAATQLGSSFTLPIVDGVTTDKIDIQVDYSVTGAVNIYFAADNSTGAEMFSYSGDTTTDSVTDLSYFSVLGRINLAINYSEMVILDSDTRAVSLQTLAPVANGKTHNFNTGSPAAANVNEIHTDDSTIDGSTTAGEIDQYTIPAIAAGTYSILAVGVSARLIRGPSGPSKMDLGLRTAATDYWSSDQSLDLAWSDYTNWWTTDPNTSAAWAALPTNIGIKSVT